MSISTILGFLAGLLMIVVSVTMATDRYAAFFHVHSLMIVVGGTLASAFISYEPRYVFLAIKLLQSIFFAPKISRDVLMGEVGRIIRWGYVVQKGGLQGLESDSKKIKGQDPFLGFGVDLVISGYTGQEVRETMQNMFDSAFHRSLVPAEILRNMAGTAPAFGLIGTLIGMVIMLDNMSGDPSQLGSGLAVALTATLYAVVAARLILLPCASKIQQREEMVHFRNEIVGEGLALLAERKNPRYIQDRLNSFLDPKIHFNIEKHMKDAR